MGNNIMKKLVNVASVFSLNIHKNSDVYWCTIICANTQKIYLKIYIQYTEFKIYVYILN